MRRDDGVADVGDGLQFAFDLVRQQAQAFGGFRRGDVGVGAESQQADQQHRRCRRRLDLDRQVVEHAEHGPQPPKILEGGRG